MAKNQLIVGGGLLVTLGENPRVMEDGAVLIEGDTMKTVRKTGELRTANPDAEFLDASGKLVMPGLINAHTHLYGSLARGIALKDAPPTNFVENLERLWWRLDKALNEDDVYYSALVGLMDAVRCGVTCLVDHHASPSCVEGSLDVVARAYEEIGIRGILAYEVSDRDGPDVRDQGIEENVRFIQKARSHPRLRGTFGLHASFTLEENTLRAAKEASNALDPGFHLHVAEDRADQDRTQKMSGKRVVERLHDAGLTGPKSLFAHCIHLNDREFDLLRDSGTRAVHNPESNLNNAVGFARTGEMLERGIVLGLGTDGYTQNLGLQARLALVVPKLISDDPRASGDPMQMLFRNNPAVASSFFGRPIGTIEEGAAADLIVMDYDPPTPLTVDNFLGHLIFGISNAHVSSVICGGHVLLKDGKFTTVDEETITSEARNRAERLWERF
jgi:putative selenium metabolism protein SsnA